MHTRTSRLAWLLALTVFLTPVVARGQDLPTPPLPLPVRDYVLPLGGHQSTGFFLSAEFLFLRQTNPIEDQIVAVRGIFALDNSIPHFSGDFIGSGAPALDVNQVSGPTTRQPGLAIYGGWRFRDGTVLEFSWWHLTDARYSATASLLGPDLRGGIDLADTFVTSPVFNFPPNYAGPLNDVAIGNPGATFGIWNAADIQTIDFVQRFDMASANVRIPLHQTEECRYYGLLGGRAIILWERFGWRTVDLDINGVAREIDWALYSNVVSNRLYGGTIGCGTDYFWGSSPIGAFAMTAEVQGGIFVDFVKERARYELGDGSTAATRAINEYTVAPMVQGDLSLWWYPTQGIQCRLGWNIMALFNTVASPRPIDFNFGSITPAWERGETRIIRGLHVGVGFVF